MMNELNPGNYRGLSEEEAAAKIKESGYNEIPTAKKRSIFAIAFEVLRQPMFLMLVGGGAIYLILGDVHEALMLLGFVFVVIGITLYQERKVERALEALRDLASPRALVILAVFLIALQLGQGEQEARALTFTALIIANLSLILTNRSWSRTILATLRTPNKALWWVIGGAVAFLGAVLYIPFLRGLFQFDRLHWNDLLICLAAGIMSIVWFEVLKIFRNGKRALSHKIS